MRHPPVAKTRPDDPRIEVQAEPTARYGNAIFYFEASESVFTWIASMHTAEEIADLLEDEDLE